MSKIRNVVIFDLDETVVDSGHRTPNHPDGTLNLPAYILQHTPENVAKDTLLPLARVMQQCYAAGCFVVVCTARDMKPCDYEYLASRNLPYHKIFSRDQCKTRKHYKMRDGEYKTYWLAEFLKQKRFRHANVVMFDDAKPVKGAMRQMGITCLCAHKVNRKLRKA